MFSKYNIYILKMKVSKHLLTKKDESGDICVEFDDLKRVINDEVANAKEHLRRLEMYQNQTNK